MSPNNSHTPYVCVIGGSNIDIEGYPNDTLRTADSNPGVVKTSLGGVGRNIAENLTRLGIKTKFLSVVGDDAYGRRVLEHAKAIGLDMDDTLVVEEPTSTYLCVLDEHREMHVGIACMDILQWLDTTYIQQHAQIIQNAAYCVVDTNLPDVLTYLVEHFDVPFILDTVSVAKATRAKDLLQYFHTIKPNKIEAEILSGISIRTEQDLQEAGRYFIDQGVQHCFITMGADGVYYKTKANEGIIRTEAVGILSTTGAGDAFVAGLVVGFSKKSEIEDIVRFSMAAARMAILSEETIHPDISSSGVEAMVQKVDFTHSPL